MNFALVFALSFGSLHAPPRTHAPDLWFADDKVKHFMMSAMIEGLAYSGLRMAHVAHQDAVNEAIGVTAAVGVGKEVRDHFATGLFSVKDLAWDAAGTAAMAAVVSHAQ